MAESATPVVPSSELLEWPKKDKRRFLHAVYRVGDLDRTIKYVIYYLIQTIYSIHHGLVVSICCSMVFILIFPGFILKVSG